MLANTYLKIRQTLNRLRVYRSLLKRAIRQYFQEARFFLRAKKRYLNKGFFEVNPAMSLRKRTHHLERYLFAPHFYPEHFAILAAQDIENILQSRKMIPQSQQQWAQKILREYQERNHHNSDVCCPLLLQDVRRQPSPITPDQMMILIRQRRSRRIFDKTPLTDEEKTLICEAAQYAPSSCNRQSLSLIFVEEPELKNFVAATISGGSQFFSQAPCILLLVSEAGDYRYPEDRMAPFLDGAAAIQNIYLLCETMGLGCCWGSYTSFGTVLQESEVRERLNIPDTYLIVASLAIGKSFQAVCDIPRDNPQHRFWNNYYGYDKTKS